MRVALAPDKFKGSATATEITDALGAALSAAGHEPIAIPMADGGDGTLEALGGANRTTTVTGPAGRPVDAAWRLSRGVAVIEMALASGLVIAGGPEENDPLTATTAGTGELIATAIARGAKRVIVGLGGSATTDGGLGAVEAIGSPARLGSAKVEVATDVTTRFVDAARVFGPQKGASPAHVAFLEARLRGVAERYRDDFGVDVESVTGGGAAGGLGGGLFALGAQIVSGFDLIADELSLFEEIAAAEVVVTGEGRLDRESFAGKVVGGVAEMAFETDTRLVIVAGQVADDLAGGLTEFCPADTVVLSLTDIFGLDAALADPAARAAEAVMTTLG